MSRFKFKYRTWLTIIAIFGLVGGASFAAVRTWSAELFPGQGPAAQQGAGGQAGQGAGTVATGGGATAGARPAGAAGAGGAGGQAGGGRTVGTVESLAGNTLTVTTQSGSVKAQLSEQTTIQKRTAGSRETTPGSRADLTAGTRVMVQGPAGEDGAVTAQTIQVLPAAGGGGRRGDGG